MISRNLCPECGSVMKKLLLPDPSTEYYLHCFYCRKFVFTVKHKDDVVGIIKMFKQNGILDVEEIKDAVSIKRE